MNSKQQKQSTFEPYENVFIGNFLYGLGLSIGSRLNGRSLPSCISLLQQTPADEMLGDVLIEFSGTVLLYEFKRSQGDEKKERRKAEKLRIVLADTPHLHTISRSVHWYVVSLPAVEKSEPKILLSPYIDTGVTSRVQPQLLSGYVNTLAGSVLNSTLNKVDPKLLKDYLNVVAALSDAESVSTGGLIVVINSEGAIQYTVLQDLRDLSLQHRQFLSIEGNRQAELRMQLDRKASQLSREREFPIPGRTR